MTRGITNFEIFPFRSRELTRNSTYASLNMYIRFTRRCFIVASKKRNLIAHMFTQNRLHYTQTHVTPLQ